MYCAQCLEEILEVCFELPKSMNDVNIGRHAVL